jgi:hypothetical protein
MTKIVYVIQDTEGEVVGVSEQGLIYTGKTPGLQVSKFKLNNMPRCGPNERPFVVFFQNADEDKPQVWPIIGFFPKEDRTVTEEGIEVIVYATDAGDAISQVFSVMHFDSWDLLKDDWRQLQ